MRLFGEFRPGRACALLLALVAVGCAAPPREAKPHLVVAGGGIGVDSDDDHFVIGKVEYRFKPLQEFLLIEPTVSASFAEDSASYFAVGIARDFWINDTWVVVPSFAAGLFDEGDQLELGSELEFRSGIELAYSFGNDARLGLGIFHLSNGGIAERNPGTESVMLSLAIPIGE